MFGLFGKKKTDNGTTLSIAADVNMIPAFNHQYFNGLADNCHFHIHRLVSLYGLGKLSDHALYVRGGYGSVELAGPESVRLVKSLGSELKASLLLKTLRNLQVFRDVQARSGRSSAEIDRMMLDVPNNVLSIFAGEAAAKLLCGRNDLSDF